MENNELFLDYGNVVERLHEPNLDQINTERINIFPGSCTEEKINSSGLQSKHIVQHIPPEEKKKIAEILKILNGIKTQGAQVKKKSRQKAWEEFKRALAKKNEAGLQGNQYHEFSKIIFDANLKGVMKALDIELAELEANLPDKSEIDASIMEMLVSQNMTREEKSFGLLRKLKYPTEIALFLAVAITAAIGVNEWGQRFFEIGGSVPNKDMPLEQLMALSVGGGVLSASVWNFKEKIWRATAEAGGEWKKFWEGVREKPKQMAAALILAGTCAGADITGYNRFMSESSKNEALIRQIEMINREVMQIIGETQDENPPEQNTFRGLDMAIETGVKKDLSAFVEIPENEEKGNPEKNRKGGKGPKYWAKYFIVHGGYISGENDIAHSFKANWPAKRRDQQLHELDIDLTVSIEQKASKIIDEYKNQSEKTEAEIKMHLKKLNDLTTQQESIIGAVRQSFSSQEQGTSPEVQDILEVINRQNQHYIQARQSLERLVNEYIEILHQFDIPTSNIREKYRIEGVKSLPKTGLSSEGLEKLLEESERKWEAVQQKIPVWLLSALIILAGGTALSFRKTMKSGKTDKLKAKFLMDYLIRWEDIFVQVVADFFKRSDFSQVLSGINIPSEIAVRNALYKTLEAINPEVKNIENRSWREKIGFKWGKSTRVAAIKANDIRASAIHKFINEKDKYFPDFFELLYPGLKLNKPQKIESFMILEKEIAVGQKSVSREFELELSEITEPAFSHIDSPVSLHTRKNWLDQMVHSKRKEENPEALFINFVEDENDVDNQSPDIEESDLQEDQKEEKKQKEEKQEQEKKQWNPKVAFVPENVLYTGENLIWALEDFPNGIHTDTINLYSSISLATIESKLLVYLEPLKTYEEYISRYGFINYMRVMEKSDPDAVRKFNDLIQEFNNNLNRMKTENRTDLIKEYIQRFDDLVIRKI